MLAVVTLTLTLTTFVSGQEQADMTLPPHTNNWHHHLRGTLLNEFESMAERFYEMQKTERSGITDAFIKFNPNFACLR